MDYEVGDKVIYQNTNAHNRLPKFYPPAGTVGEVKHTIPAANVIIVKWQGMIPPDDEWACNIHDVSPFKEGGGEDGR